jgi:EF hand
MQLLCFIHVLLILGACMTRQVWALGLLGTAVVAAGLAWKSSSYDLSAQAVETGSDTRMLPPLSVAPAAPPVVEPARTQVQTPEQKRMNRYDKDDNGAVTRGEFLGSRQKAFAKLDLNGDGALSFDEYAVKTIEKFSKADGNRDGGLSAGELMTTAQKRSVKKLVECLPEGKAEE